MTRCEAGRQHRWRKMGRGGVKVTLLINAQLEEKKREKKKLWLELLPLFIPMTLAATASALHLLISASLSLHYPPTPSPHSPSSLSFYLLHLPPLFLLTLFCQGF